MNDHMKPPQSIEVESSVLGAMLLDKECLPKVFEILKAEHFYLKKHEIIFDAMTKLYTESEPIDTVSVYEKLQKVDKLNDVGGAGYISQLEQNIGSAANVEYHSKIVLEKWMLRQIISTSMNAATMAYESSEDVVDIANKILNDIYSITNIFERKRGQVISTIARKVIEQIEQIKKGDTSDFALKSGFKDLDDKIIGFKKAELTIIAARPSMGKTAFLLRIAKNLSKGKWGAIFSLEMGDESLYTRLLGAETGIEFNDLISGRFSIEKGADIARSAHKLNELKLFIDDTPALSIIELQSKARRLKNEFNIGWIGVDYLQLMKATAGNREQEISKIAQVLKAIAKELNIPVIALAQLNRNLESRSDKTPQLSDLRESGDIENAADLIIFLYRPEVYGIEKINDYGEQISTKNLAYAIIGKQRNGILGEIKLTFLKETMRFENYQKESFMVDSNYYDKEDELPI